MFYNLIIVSLELNKIFFMKNLFIGLAIGVILCGLACFLAMPGVKQTAYDSGFKAGNIKGIAAGKATGINEGIAEIKSEQKQASDSLAVDEQQKREEALQRAARKPKKLVKEVQNWHVIDGKIAEPIPG
jgi:hypothetical protein